MYHPGSTVIKIIEFIAPHHTELGQAKDQRTEISNENLNNE